PRLLAHVPYPDNNLYFDYGDTGSGRVYTSYASYLSAWTLVTLVYDNTVPLHAIYLNGALIVSSGNSTSNPGLTGLWICEAGGNYDKRQLDEYRISKIGRSTNWILTEYNNQNAPGNIGAGNFLTYSAENAIITTQAYTYIANNLYWNGSHWMC